MPIFISWKSHTQSRRAGCISVMWCETMANCSVLFVIYGNLQLLKVNNSPQWALEWEIKVFEIDFFKNLFIFNLTEESILKFSTAKTLNFNSSFPLIWRSMKNSSLIFVACRKNDKEREKLILNSLQMQSITLAWTYDDNLSLSHIKVELNAHLSWVLSTHEKASLTCHFNVCKNPWNLKS